MTNVEVLSQSLRLLSSAERRKFYVACAFQSILGILDLLGVLLIGIVGATSVATLQSGQLPAVLTGLLDSIGAPNASSTSVILVLATIAAALLIVKSAAATVGMRRIVRFLANRQAVWARDLSQRLLQSSLSFVRGLSSQATAYALMQGANAMSLYVLAQAIVVVAEVSSLAMVILALVLVNPFVALSAVLSFALVAVAIHLFVAPKAGAAGRRLAQADVDSLESVQDALLSFREIAIWRRQAFFAQRIFMGRLESAGASADLLFLSLLPKYILEGALVLVGGLVAAYLFATQPAELAVASLAVFVAAATRIIPSILRLQGAALTVRNSHGAVEKTLNLARAIEALPVEHLVCHDLEYPGSESVGASVEDAAAPQVTLNDVSFSYPGSSRPAVDRVSITAKSGSSLALVGPSGAGKSTLADLIIGLLVPNSGAVRIQPPGGLKLDRDLLDLGWNGARVAYVPQRVALLRATVAENVAFGIDPERINLDLVLDSLAKAGLDPSEFGPEGVDTQVGEGGNRISGGQRQRLGIARALYTCPRLIVLDEATSALDAASEDVVARTLEGLRGTATIIVIAHRLSTVRRCDRVAYVDAGNVVAEGSFDEVRALVPDFHVQATLMGL